MKELLIVIGDYGSGKTKFSKDYGRQNGATYINHDMLRVEVDLNGFLSRLKYVISNDTNTLFVLDGWGERPPKFAALASYLNVKIKLCYCFASPQVLHNRQQEKNSETINDIIPRSMKEIKNELNVTYQLVTTSPYELLYVDTSDNYEYLDKDTAFQRIQGYSLLASLDDYTHDKYYQNIELPGGVVFKGYSNSAETWERLKQLDYKGKRILDVGCFHGYFSFKAEENGATYVKGIDASDLAIKVANEIACLRHSSCDFEVQKGEDIDLSESYDIIFVLNMLHHVKDPDKLMTGVFTIGRNIVFEIERTQVKTIQQYADKYGYNISILNSHRINRLFLICQNPSFIDIVPEIPEYKFTTYDEIKHKATKIKHVIMTMIMKVITLPGIHPIAKACKNIFIKWTR